MNASDSEKIETILKKKRHKKSEVIESANILVINCCSVRQAAMDRVFGLIHKWKDKKKIILAGCLLESDRKRMKERGIKFLYPDEYFFSLPCRLKKFRATVPIMTGCDNFCSYCVVPYSRGREKSRKSEEILKEIKCLIKNGCKEITLLGQNVNSYRDGKTDFPKLLKKINSLPGDFWIRFMTSHPKDMSDDLIGAIARSKKVCEYVHLPIQAGSDEILTKMNRKYSAKDYLKLIDKIRTAFRKYKPDIPFALSTDIIVGFPGETKKQFAESADIMKGVGFDMIYIGEYSPRVGTAAWKMTDDVSRNEKTRRKKLLDKILKKTALANNKFYIGLVQKILVESEKKGFYFGKNRTMKDVRFQSDRRNLIGQFAKVKIMKASAWNLEGKVEG